MIALGGAIGALARYGLSIWAARRFGVGFPWGTLLVNLSGCFLIGWMMVLLATKPWFSENLRMLVIAGFLGSLTTFSTFSYDTLALIDEDRWRAALLSMAANLCLGLTGVVLGRMFGRMMD